MNLLTILFVKTAHWSAKGASLATKQENFSTKKTTSTFVFPQYLEKSLQIIFGRT